MTMIKDFFTGLQFLTRIHVIKQTEWSAESFGRSVKFFPLIGLVLGMVLVFMQQLLYAYFPLYGLALPLHVRTALLLLIMIVLSGGLTADGFMDTMDGVFSGRSRERMLEIMKDSRVGANGVMAFVLLMLIKWSLLLDMPVNLLSQALFIMPVLGKLSMVIAITMFPYARPDGIGKAFAQFAGKYSLLLAGISTLAILYVAQHRAVAAAIAVTVFSILFSRYITKILGGLTGDIYGCANELAEVLVLLVFIL